MFEAFEMPREVQPMFEARFIDFSIGPRAMQTTYLAGSTAGPSRRRSGS